MENPKKNLIWIVSGVVLSVASMTSVLNSDLREKIKGFLSSEYRVVLSTVSGNVDGLGEAKIVKVKTHKGLFLEVYGPSENGHSPMKSKIPLNESRDAYVNYKDKATNLILDDVDGDNLLEIIAPFYDKALVAHLNVFKYDKNSGTFNKLTKDELKN